MKLSIEERFAINKLFSGECEFDRALLSQTEFAVVTERRNTGVGCFSTILFPKGLPGANSRVQWDWNFEHRDARHGGSITASYAAPNLIDLEFVMHDGEWPKEFDPDAFIEQTI